jgi:hypothetical protein
LRGHEIQEREESDEESTATTTAMNSDSSRPPKKTKIDNEDNGIDVDNDDEDFSNFLEQELEEQ